jgi:hypothetical protein
MHSRRTTNANRRNTRTAAYQDSWCARLPLLEKLLWMFTAADFKSNGKYKKCGALGAPSQRSCSPHAVLTWDIQGLDSVVEGLGVFRGYVGVTAGHCNGGSRFQAILRFGEHG